MLRYWTNGRYDWDGIASPFKSNDRIVELYVIEGPPVLLEFKIDE
jgi:hypothetical protein